MKEGSIIIKFKNSSQLLFGIFYSHEGQKIYLKNATFDTEKNLTFPFIVISECSVKGITKPSEAEINSFFKGQIPEIYNYKKVENFKTDDEIKNDKNIRTESIERYEVEKKVDDKKVEDKKAEDKKPAKPWNQFEANLKLFNIKPEFDEKEYMDVLDKDSDTYKNKVEMAKRIEKEILSTPTSDPHRIEERTGVKTSLDDDAAYSTVILEKKDKNRSLRSPKPSSPVTPPLAEKNIESGTLEPHLEAATVKAIKTPISKEISSKPVKLDEKAEAGNLSTEHFKENQAEIRKKKITIEVEGLLIQDKSNEDDMHETEKHKNIQNNYTKNVKDSNKVYNSDKSQKEKSPDQGHTISFGWKNSKYASCAAMVESVKSNFNYSDKQGKWGSGDSWELLARGMSEKSSKYSKSSMFLKQMTKRNPVSK